MSDNQALTFEEIESWLRRALELDEEYVPALLELGYFFLNLMDDAVAALPLFESARQLVTQDATEVLVGLAECIAETDSPPAALELLQQENLMIDSSKLEELRRELRDQLN